MVGTIPQMKTILITLTACFLFLSCGKEEELPEFKACTHCQEQDIRFMADVCKHCGNDPDGPNGKVKRAAWKAIEKEMSQTVSVAKMRDNYTVQINGLQSQIERLKEEIEEERANSKLAVNRMRQKMETDVAMSQAAYKALEAMQRPLQQRLAEMQEHLADLEQKLFNEEAAHAAWKEEREEIKNALEEAKKKNLESQKLARQILDLESKLTQYTALGTPSEIKAKLKLHPDRVSKVDPKNTEVKEVGKIVNVDEANGFLVINVGAEHGYKVGDSFNVFRGAKLVGKIVVLRVTQTASIVKRSPGAGGQPIPFKIGDRITISK